MNVAIEPSLEHRLHEIARRESVPLDALVHRILSDYAQRSDDDPQLWVRMTQGNLANVWPREDFSDWSPPNAVQ